MSDSRIGVGFKLWTGRVENMSLLAETLVEEWFNRGHYFTIRGIKDKIEEIDILAIKNLGNSEWDCIHCEVQVGVRPVTYISRLTKELMVEMNVKAAKSAKVRTHSQLGKCVDAWIETKFTGLKKAKVRNQLFYGAQWQYMFVHGNVKELKELELIQDHGVKLIPIEEIISVLCNQINDSGFTASSAGDLIEIINFYNKKIKK